MAEISKEYAEALFSLACESGTEGAVLDALVLVSDTMAQNPDYALFLSSPGISLEERIATVDQVFGASVPEHVVSFLQLLCEKRRIQYLTECIEEYRKLWNAAHAVVVAKVTSAVPLTEEEQAGLKKKLERDGATVMLDCHVDPAILGGIIVETNGKVIDGSLRHQLLEVKEVINR